MKRRYRLILRLDIIRLILDRYSPVSQGLFKTCNLLAALANTQSDFRSFKGTTLYSTLV